MCIFIMAFSAGKQKATDSISAEEKYVSFRVCVGPSMGNVYIKANQVHSESLVTKMTEAK